MGEFDIKADEYVRIEIKQGKSIIKIGDIKIEELEKECKEKQDRIYELEDTIENMKEDCILDIDNFKWQLRNDNLYSQELETFIENYMRFYNKWGA